ncbi:MAG: hypothetical protein AAB607_01175 [Patescibacteria group bacterium]
MKLNTQYSILNTNRGQSLVEMIISISLGVVFLGIAAGSVTLILRNNLEARTSQIAASLAQEYLDGVSAMSESNWLAVYNPPAAKGVNSQFYLDVSGVNYSIISGATSTDVENRSFSRYFSIENANRENCGTGSATESVVSGNCAVNFPGISTDISEDPSTQKITATVEWDNGQRKISLVKYLTRSRNASFRQSGWQGGFNQENFPSSGVNNKFTTSTNIDYTTSTGAIIIQGF